MIKVFFCSAIIIWIPFSTNAQASKSFKWVAWKNVTANTKAELKKITNSKDETAYDYIIENIEKECTVEVAVLDMDGDGKMEYAVGYSGQWCCGFGRYHGECSLLVYKDFGKKQILLSDEWESVKPAKNGVISSWGKLIPFIAAKWLPN